MLLESWTMCLHFTRCPCFNLTVDFVFRCADYYFFYNSNITNSLTHSLTHSLTLRDKHLESTQEAERAERMLELQTAINQDLKAEIDDLQRANEDTVLDLNQKLADARKLLEARQKRLGQVEAQLKDVLYSDRYHSSKKGKRKLTQQQREDAASLVAKGEERIELIGDPKPASKHKLRVPGSLPVCQSLLRLLHPFEDCNQPSPLTGNFGPNENIVEVWVKKARLNPICAALGAERYGDSQTDLSTFVYVDFFDFETQSTQLHPGLYSIVLTRARTFTFFLKSLSLN